MYVYFMLAVEINEYMRSDVLTVVNIKIKYLWDLTPCTLVDF
jgi:hypothetical protein